MTQLIGVPLKTGIDPIGSFSFYTKQKDPIPHEKFSLLIGICSQIAVAVQNVLKNELNEKNDFEKRILLEICNDLSIAKDRTALSMIIKNKLNKLLPFNNYILGLTDSPESDFISPVLHSKNNYSEIGYNRSFNGKMPLNEATWQRLIPINFPIVFDLAAQTKTTDVLLSFLKIHAGHEELEAAFVCLFEENKLIGFLGLFSDTPKSFTANDLRLLKGVSSQLSSVASNILIKENLRNKELEKSFLLSFSNHIATVRDINGLKFIIRQSLKQLPIPAYIITIKNDNDKTYCHFLHELPHGEPDDEGFKIITGTNMSKKGTLTELVLASEEPITFEIKEVLKKKKIFFPAYSFWKAAGAEKILGVRLKVADEDMGILWLEPDKINARLLKGISAQIAIALANAMANASLDKQFDEIQRYKQRLEEENIYLQNEIGTNHNNSEIIGSGPEMDKIFQLVSQVAYTGSTVLLLGETGTGKELVARAIHNISQRKNNLMVKVNCAAFPPNLIESELFGHERGSFTGAIEQKIGKFELANNGTLFLDEIGEMPADLQVKILRALQEREIERVGGKKTIKINVRIIAATNRNLQQEVVEGRFRSDLFYRLNVFPVTLPSLRQRTEDIPQLVEHFIKKHARNTGKQVSSIAIKALQELMAYPWPGNVRELEHMIERSLLLSSGDTIKHVYLPAAGHMIGVANDDSIFKTIDENERGHIIAVLRKCNGKIFGEGGAAAILGIPPSTLNSKIKKLGIKKDQLIKN
jgi:formate hydrogenlyase transcriptional activator